MEKIKDFLKKDVYKKIKVWHLLVVLIVVSAAGPGSGGTSSKSSSSKCLIGTWGYPSADNATSAWSFDKNGTFLFSTTALGGGRSTGEWSVNDDKVHITYTSNSNGYNLDDQTLILSDCNTLKVGSTVYEKD